MKLISVNKLKPNPINPRTIRDDKFTKLVQSIKDFPEMLDKRPIVCNTEKKEQGCIKEKELQYRKEN